MRLRALSSRRTNRLAVAAGTAALVVLAPLGVASSVSADGRQPGMQLRAVVSFTGSEPVSAPGLTVVDVFPRVGAEVVTGTAAQIRALTAHPRVVGISPDDALTLTGKDHDDDDASVFAWEGIDKAGRTESGGGVTVALLDTGVSDTPALNRASGRLIDGVDTSRLRSGGTARTTGTFSDGYGHGTFMANLIAGGPTENTPGKRGVGVAPGARVVVVKVADDQGTTSLSQVLAGFDWVAAQSPKIQVVSVALGHPRPQSAYGADPLTAAVDHVMDYGVLVVAASGNTPGQVEDPGLAPRAITIGAADLTGDETVAPFSGSGTVQGVRKPDIVASGVGLLSLMPPRSVIARNNPRALQSNGFYRGSGTSESTAVTSGSIAVLLSAKPNARLVDVKPALRVSADQIDGGWAQGQGLLDIDKAFKRLRKFSKQSDEDPTGENALDTRAWQRNSWLNGAWEKWLANSWSANSWAADGSWAANSWSANSWGSASWSANSWSANSWSANSWSANSWSANSWSANSWSANSWSANSWSANSWSANSWSAASWGDDG